MFPTLITLIVIVLVIVAVVSLGRAIFSGGGSDTSEEQVDEGRTALLETGSDRAVSLTVRGPIVAEEEHKSYRIIVSPSNRSMTIYKGYLDEQERAKTLRNNGEAYEQFVHALDKANMMKGIEPEDEKLNDLRGLCATGYVYEYAVLLDDSTIKRLWTSTCDGSKGTLQASVQQLNNLFLSQIPDSDKLVPFKSNPLRGLSF